MPDSLGHGILKRTTRGSQRKSDVNLRAQDTQIINQSKIDDVQSDFGVDDGP